MPAGTESEKTEFITTEQLIGRALDRGIALGPNPHQTINLYIQRGLVPQLINGMHPATAVDRVVSIDSMLKEGKSLEEIQEIIRKERRSFLRKAVDLTSLVNTYNNSTFKSLLMLGSLLVLAVLSIVAVTSVSPSSKTFAGVVAHEAAKPVGITLAAIIRQAKPENENASTDPLGLTNISKVITINEKQQVVLEKTVSVASPTTEISSNLNADKVDNADAGTGAGDVLLLDNSGNIDISGEIKGSKFTGDGSGLTNLSLPNTLIYSNQSYANPGWLTSLAWSKLASRPSLLTSVDGVSNDSGDIDFIAGTGVTITSNDTNNTITFDLAGSGVNADLLDSIDSSQFLRSDTGDSFTSGTLTTAVGTTLSVLGTFSCTDCIGDAAVVNTITASNYLPLAGGTMAGNIDFNNNLAINIGNAGTDFTSGGGLTLAGTETLSALSISSGSRVANTTTFNPNAGGSQYGYNLSITNTPTVTANTAYGFYVNQSDTTTFANNNYGVYSAVTHTGTTAGITETYGGYFSATGDSGGTSIAYGLYSTTSGADLNYGVYGEGSTYGVYGSSGAVTGVGVEGSGLYNGVFGMGSVGVVGAGTNAGSDTKGVYGYVAGAMTNDVYAGYFSNATATSSTAGINKYGLYVTSTGVWNGAGANNYGLYIANATGGTNNYTLYLAGSGGTSSTGITFAGDTNLYRGSANILATDDNLEVGLHAAIGSSSTPVTATILRLVETRSDEQVFNGFYSTPTSTYNDTGNPSLYGIRSVPTYSGADTSASITGVDTIAMYSGSGSASSVIALSAGINTSGAGSVTTIKGISIATPVISGAAPTTAYGLEIDDLTSGGTRYPIYQGGTNGTNVFLAGTSLFGRTASGNDTAHAVVIQGSLCVDDSTPSCPAGPTAGAIYVENSVGAGNVSAFDIAEYYPATEPTEKGDLVSAAGNSAIKKSSQSYDQRIIGVVSTEPAVVVDETNITFGKGAGASFNSLKPYVALAGRVPLKVSTENGSIEPGDPLTSSSLSGVAMKATRSGPIVGKALEAYSGSGVGKIEVFVSVGWYVEPLAQDVGFKTSDLSNLSSINLENLTANNLKTQFLIIGDRKLSMLNDGSLSIDGNTEIAGSLKVAGAIDTKNLSTDELEIGAKSSGQATLAAGTQEVEVKTGVVKDESKIFITFNSEYSPATRYWITKNVDYSFTLHLNATLDKNSSFSWLLIN